MKRSFGLFDTLRNSFSGSHWGHTAGTLPPPGQKETLVSCFLRGFYIGVDEGIRTPDPQSHSLML